MVALLKKLIAVFTAILLSAGVYVAPSTANPVAGGSADEEIVRIALLSDSQIWANSDRHWAYKAALEDIENNADDIDGVVLAGDLTESGDDPTDELVVNMLGDLSVGRKIIASGNHDVRLMYSHTMNRFIQDVNALACADYEVTKPYYYTTVAGYYFIVLGTEKQALEKAYISDEQLAFLDRTLVEATADGKPAFVVCHQPLANTHGLPDIWRTGDLGAQSGRVAEITEKYDNVFFLSGHTHNGFGQYTYDDSLAKTHLINIPPVGKKASREYASSGQGFVMEIYADRVVFRSRVFSSGCYLGDTHPEFDRVYGIG